MLVTVYFVINLLADLNLKNHIPFETVGNPKYVKLLLLASLTTTILLQKGLLNMTL